MTEKQELREDPDCAMYEIGVLQPLLDGNGTPFVGVPFTRMGEATEMMRAICLGGCQILRQGLCRVIVEEREYKIASDKPLREQPIIIKDRTWEEPTS